MGYSFTGPDDGPIPRMVFLRFTCDGDHGSLPAPALVSDGAESYIEFHHRAIIAGWSETSLRILCPECKKGPRRSGAHQMDDLFD